MEIIEVNTLKDFMKYKDAWISLSSDCEFSNPFLDFDKMCVSIAYLEKYRTNRIKIYVVKEKNEVVMIAPFEERVVYRAVKIRYFLGNEFCDYTDIPTKKGYEKCFEALIKKKSSFNTIYIIRCLPENGKLTELLKNKININFSLLPQTVCPITVLEKYEGEIIDNLSKKTRYDINYNLRRLRREGEPEFFEAKTPEEKLEIIEILLKLHTEEWHERGNAGLLDDPETCDYYRMMSQMISDEGSSLSVTALKLNGEYVAVHMGFENSEGIYYYKPAFNVKFSKFSPGKLLIYYNMLMCKEKGLPKFDFLVGEETYKYNWYTDESVVYTGFVSLNNPISKLLLSMQIKRDMPTHKFPGLHEDKKINEEK